MKPIRRLSSEADKPRCFECNQNFEEGIVFENYSSWIPRVRLCRRCLFKAIPLVVDPTALNDLAVKILEGDPIATDVALDILRG